MQIKSMRELPVEEKRVLVRVDYNVPLDKEGNITDDTRIVASLPTIRYLVNRRAKVVLASHLGRPDGKVVDSMRLNPVARRLAELLNQEVLKLDDCIGPKVREEIAELPPGGVMLLENIRFYPGEEKNDPAFVQELADLADFYVNDAFGTAHRAHASTAGIAELLPSGAGFLLEKEFNFLYTTLEKPRRPFTAIVGGAKVSSKIGVLEHLMDKVDTLLIGGAMAFTFLKSLGRNVGASKVEEDKLELAKEIILLAASKGVGFILPVDAVAAETFSPEAATAIVDFQNFPPGWMGLDIGPATVERFAAYIRRAGTILWNGPLGVFEMEPFAKGTAQVARLLAESDGITIIGGGDSVAAVHQLGYADKMTHISTGGGASLEMIEGKVLPGVAVLMK